MVSWWVHHVAKGLRSDFNNGPGDNSNSGRILPQRLFESNSKNGPSRGHFNLGTLKKITTASTIAALLISLFSRQNAMRRAQNVKRKHHISYVVHIDLEVSPLQSKTTQRK